MYYINGKKIGSTGPTKTFCSTPDMAEAGELTQEHQQDHPKYNIWVDTVPAQNINGGDNIPLDEVDKIFIEISLNRFRDGEALTDGDINALINYFNVMVTYLEAFGAEMRLEANYSRDRLNTLESYKLAREHE